jgi:hypothetical protein
VREAVGTAGDDAAAFRCSIDGGLHGLERRGVKADEIVFAEEDIELGGGKFVCAGEVDRVGDDEEVVFVVLDFRERAGRNTVLDGERVKLKNGFEDELPFLVGGFVEVDPEEEAFVSADEAERLALEVLTDEFAVAEDEGTNHREGI